MWYETLDFRYTAFGDNAIFDSMGNFFTDTVRRASIQLFESNEGAMKLVWRQVVANLVEVLFGYNPSYCVFDQSRMKQTGMDIIKQ